MSDMNYIDTKLIDLLNCLQKAETADSQTEAITLITDGYDPWMESGYPLLTPRARAVLAAMEEAVKECVGCPDKVECDRRMRNGDVESWCRVANLAPIRKAYKENK